MFNFSLQPSLLNILYLSTNNFNYYLWQSKRQDLWCWESYRFYLCWCLPCPIVTHPTTSLSWQGTRNQWDPWFQGEKSSSQSWCCDTCSPMGWTGLQCLQTFWHAYWLPLRGWFRTHQISLTCFWECYLYIPKEFKQATVERIYHRTGGS